MAGNKLGRIIRSEVERGYRLTGTIKTDRIKIESRSRLARWMDYYGTRGLVLIGGYLVLSIRLNPGLSLASATLVTLMVDYAMRRRQQTSLTRMARDKARRRMALYSLDALIAGAGPEYEKHARLLSGRLDWSSMARLPGGDADRTAFLGQKGDQRSLLIIDRCRQPAGSADINHALLQAVNEEAQTCWYLSTAGFSEPAALQARSKGVQLIDLSHLAGAKPSPEQAPAAGPPEAPAATPTPERSLEQTLQKLILGSMSGLKSGAILALVSLLVGGPMRLYFLVFAAVNIGFSGYYYLKARRYLLLVGGHQELF